MVVKSYLVIAITLAFTCTASASFIQNLFGGDDHDHNREHFHDYTPVEDYLDGLPRQTSVREYSVEVPDDTREILVYLFVLASVMENPVRSYYQIYTLDEEGTKYSQYMNVGFAQNDFTLNSANVWLPMFSEKKFYVSLIAPTALSASTQEMVKFTSIADTLAELQTPSSQFVSGVFLTGYRED